MRILPNLIVANLGGTLHAWPITGNGRVCDPSMKFMSEYDVPETDIVFSSYDPKKNWSEELMRYTCLRYGKPIKTQAVLNDGTMPQFVKRMLEHFMEKGPEIDDSVDTERQQA